jgi:Glu-tRNA(Gln) amidotransferase subunit E-like FAD-binding protein
MRLAAFMTVCLMFLCVSLAQAETLTTSQSIPFSEDSGASDDIKNECKFETRLPEYLKKEAKRTFDVVLSKEPLEDAEGKTLSLIIANMYGLGGGAFSGSKSAIVTGELKENGEVIASMSLRRHSIMGMAPGTCSILKRIAKKMGEDIAEWLEEPTMDAELGDLEDDE